MSTDDMPTDREGDPGEDMISRLRSSVDADYRDYAAWRADHQPPTASALAAVWATVDRDRPAIEERFTRDWKMELPDSIFRFWAFLLSLGPVERKGLGELDLGPFGIMDLFDDPAALPRDGVDVRVHGRFYRDPPEFVTFMRGGTDGLHYGLWYDDGRTCTGIASYYNNDGGGVGLPSGTPLTAVRASLEWAWRDTDLEAGTEAVAPLGSCLTRLRFRLRALREVVMFFETGDRHEEGEEYHETYRASHTLLRHGDPDRFETLDGGGARVAGRTSIARGRQRPFDDYDFCTGLDKVLTGDPDAMRTHVAEARRRCAAGDPADALTLGRDLHWVSRGDPERERLAHELLVLAYRALGRDNLAEIASAHYRHRDLPAVNVLRP